VETTGHADNLGCGSNDGLTAAKRAREGADELGVDLDDHIRTVVEALQPIAAELGLPG
jgi:predicted hydrolase (HD superfamily)